MRSKAVLLAGIVPAALMVGGCQDPTYEAPRACSIPAETVEALIGTDRFTAGREELERVPFTAQSTNGSSACRIDAGDDSFTVNAQVVPSSEAPRRAAAIRAEGDSFASLGGVARADDRQGGWACGSVWVTVSLDGERTADAKTMRTALEAVADEAGCYTAEAPE